MATELAKAYVQIVPSAEGISGSLTEALSGEATSAGESSGKTLGSKLSVAAVAAVGAAAIGKQISAAINEGMDFDTAMSQLAATMGTTTDQIQDLRDYAQEMGATTAFSATEAAEGLNTLAMSGLDAEEQIAALPSVMNLASAGALSLDSAASYVTGTIKGFGDSMDNAEYYADMMAKGATLANTDVNDLGEALSGAAATASSYGQEADSVTVALLRLAEQNITGSEATTMLNRTMSDLYTPTDAAKSALEELGVATYDEQGNARDLNDVVDELDDALAGMSDEEANAYKDTIFTTNGLKGFNDMTASSSETVNKFKDGLADMSGSAAQQAATQLDNLAGDVTLFNSAVSGAQIAVSDALTPALREVTQFGTDAISAFTEGFLEDGLNGVLDAGADIVNSLSEGISNNLSGILDCGIMAIGDFIGGLGTNVNEIIAAGLNLIGSLLEGIIESIPTLVAEAPVAIAEFIAGFGASLPDVIQAGWDLLNSVAEGITTAIPQMVEQIPEVILNVKQAFMDTDWAQVASDILDAIGGGIVTFASLVTDMISTLASDAIDFFTKTDWGQAGQDAINFIIDGITELFTDIPGKLQEVANSAIEYFQEADWIQQGRDLIDNIVSGIVEFFSHIGEELQEVAQDAIEKFGETDWLQLGKDLIDGIIDGITGAVGGLLGSVGTFCSDVFGKVKGFFGIGGDGDMEDEGEEITEDLGKGIVKGDTGQYTEEQASSITNTIKGWFGSGGEGDVEAQGEEISEGLAEGITNGSGEAEGAMETASEGILGAIKGFFGISSPSTVMESQGEFMSEGLVEGLSDLAQDVTDCFEEMGETVLDWCESSQSGMESAGQEMDLAIVHGMQYLPTDMENEALKPASKSLEEWGSDIAKEATKDAKNFLKNITDGIKSLPKDVKSTLDSTLNNVISWATSMGTKATDAAKTFLKNFTNGVKSLPTDLNSTLTTATGKVTDWASTLNSKGETAGEKLVSGVNSGLSDLNSTIKSRLDSANTTVTNYKDTFKSSGESLGSNLISGMVNGLNNNSSSLYSTITSIVNTAISKANSAAATGSPSKKTMWTGQMMDEGLALGLTKYENVVYDAMDEVMSIVDRSGSLTASGVATAQAEAGEAGSGVTVNQYIYSQAQTAAALMREARYEQQRALLRGF